MLKRLSLILVVFAVALGLLALQNKVLVGSQELHAQSHPQGASPATCSVEFKDLPGNLVPATAAEVEEIKRRLAGGGNLKPVKTSAVSDVTPDHTVDVTLAPGESAQNLAERIEAKPFKRDNPPRGLFHINLGIDLRGGVEFICQLYNDNGDRVAADDEVVHVLRSRLDERGLTEPAVSKLSNGDVQVVIPGGTTADAARTRKVLETTGRLEFREVLDTYYEPAKVVAKPNGGWDFSSTAYHNRGDIVAAFKSEPNKPATKWCRLSNPPALTGSDIADASGTLHNGQPAIAIQFTTLGAARNHDFTSAVKKKGDENSGTGAIAILFDGVVQSDPHIEEPSSNSCIIHGSFTDEQVESLRTVLKGGSLSVTPVVISQRVVGATLGAETVARSVQAMVWSFALIVGFMLIYYRRLGTVANLCLLVTTALIYATMSVFGATVTLPGLAGLVLTIGMAVDTNILIFERIREEMRDGKDLKAAIEAGYARAFLTILDSHVTTLITAMVLYVIGSGPVKGFGLSLAIGIVVNLFSGVYAGRLFTDWLCRKARTVSMARWVPELRFPYVRMRYLGYTVSILTGLAGALWFAFGHYATGDSFERNFDIDFTGGNMAQVIFMEPLTLEQVDQALENAAQNPNSELKPKELRKQPYYSSFGDDSSGKSRQWVFRARDEQGSILEKQRVEVEGRLAQLEVKRAQLTEAGDKAAATALKVDIDQLAEARNAVRDQIANRSAAFQIAIAKAFPDRIAAEGDEIRAAGWADQTATLDILTIEKPDPSQVADLAEHLRKGHDHFAKVDAQPLADGNGVRIAVTYHQEPPPLASLIVQDALAKRLTDLLTTAAGVPATQINARVQAALEAYHAANDAAAKVRLTVAKPFPATEHFSGQVAGQMKLRALVAVLVSLVAILAYVAARFEFAFGMGAIIALFHDVVLTVGLCSLIGIRIDLTVVASVLTLIGYSINDTIVTFDRIRENLRKLRKGLAETIDISIAQTMPRTVLTTSTVVVVVAVLLVFGGDALRPFSASLLIGLISGTYSSIFVAAPLLLAFDRGRGTLIGPSPAEPTPGEPATANAPAVI